MEEDSSVNHATSGGKIKALGVGVRIVETRGER